MTNNILKTLSAIIFLTFEKLQEDWFIVQYKVSDRTAYFHSVLLGYKEYDENVANKLQTEVTNAVVTFQQNLRKNYK